MMSLICYRMHSGGVMIRTSIGTGLTFDVGQTVVFAHGIVVCGLCGLCGWRR
jgi:hypothetical protein